MNEERLSAELSGFPRTALGVWPTPLEDCPRLSERLGGPRILVKRDDVNGLGAGGNKLRKLEFLLGDALARGADTVLTYGALQTNHGRQTAAACAKVGLRCELVLTARAPRTTPAYTASGNLALDRLYGARVHVCASPEETGATALRVRSAAQAEGRAVAEFPTGGSSGVGALGYVVAAAEVLTQLDSLGVAADRIVLAQGSAGTAAGLAVGLELLGWPGIVHAACVAHEETESAADVRRVADEVTSVLGRAPAALERVRWTAATLGPGYGVPTEQVWTALRTVGSTEGIALDPVYTGKAAAALIAAVSSGEIPREETVVFLHSGGLPGLFGYAEEFPAAGLG